MAVGTDGRYYGEAELSKEAAAKFAAKAEDAKPKAKAEEEKVVEPPKADAENVRDDAGETVPVTEPAAEEPATRRRPGSK